MKTMLYVGNLSFDATEKDLLELFGQYGQVVSAEIIIDRATGRSRGFAFVGMASGAQEAIDAIDTSAFQGRTLKVNVANGRWWNTQRPPCKTS